MGAVASPPRMCVHRVLPAHLAQRFREHAKAEQDARFASLVERPLSAALLTASHWAPGRLLRIAFRGGTRADRKEVLDAADIWMQFANIKFRQVTSGPAEVRVSFDPGGSWSYIGSEILAIPSSEPTLNIGWPNDFGRSLHELGHTLGLIHEHQNPLAHIPWNEDAVIAYYAGSPNFWPPQTTRENVLDNVDPSTLTNGGFDRKSIMLYPIAAELVKDPSYATPWNTCLSDGDKHFISTIYPGVKSA